MNITEVMEKAGFASEEIEKTLALDSLYPEMRDLAKGYMDRNMEAEPQEIDGYFETVLKDGVTVRQLDFLFLCHAYSFLYDKYQEKGYSDEMFTDVLSDLLSKTRKCEKIYGEIGSFVFGWHWEFLRLERFQLGRIQYGFLSTYRFDTPYEKGGVKVCKGDLVLDCHIPATGPLTEELCFDSYRKAHKFFAHLFPDGITRFTCSTYLFYPPHLHFYGKNTRRFASDFDIVNVTEKDKFDDAWRIFYTFDTSDPDKLPEETTLQKNFKECLRTGSKYGSGYGIFLFDGEKIIKE
ncbi:MAG: DUF5596 domain-containing protein [Clostridia bacterium]|nr:DUF5596 domain-containing protein [Clostridia bacterium]